ncbi:hypothetical protein BH11ARM1_BH11ARM1_06940 [soil metagenome]
MTGVLAIGAAMALPKSSMAEAGRSADLRGSWSTRPLLPRTGATMTTLTNGWVLLVGGLVNERAISSVVVIDPTTGRHADLTPLRNPRAYHAAAAMPDGSLIILGGMDSIPLQSVERFEFQSNRWEYLAPLELPRYDFCASAAAGQILLFGGQGIDAIPALGTYTVLTTQPEATP